MYANETHTTELSALSKLQTQQELYDLTTLQLTMQQQFAIGIYLTFVGILGTIANSLVLGSFYKYRSLAAGGNVLLISLCVSDLGMCVFGFPFSASSSFANRWLFGDAACQGYAFLGFLFGSASICTLAMLALDRYLVMYQPNNKTVFGYNRYRAMLITIWAYGLFWSILPLIGWSRYNYEPARTTCTIDWQNNDTSYTSFIITYFIFGYVVPLSIMIFCYYKVIKELSSKTRGGRNNLANINWAEQKSITKLCILLVLAFVVFWSAYAVVCLWTVFAEPTTVPLKLALLPPLLAKISPVVNPVLYVMVDKRIRQAVFAVATCHKSVPSREHAEIAESIHINATDSSKYMKSDN